MSRGRICLLAPYWDFWEASTGPELREEQRLIGDAAGAMIGAADIAITLSVDGPGRGADLAGKVRAVGAETVLVVQSMAVPPAWTMEVLEGLTDLPVVVFACYRDAEAGPGFGHAEITRGGATVGGAQLVNVLSRRGRAHELVVGRLGDPDVADRLNLVVTAAIAADRISQARIAQVGQPPTGYECVEIDPDRLRRATGVEISEIAPGVVQTAYRQVAEDAVVALRTEIGGQFDVDEELGLDDGLERSLRLACALRDLDERNGWSAGAINCHVPEIRYAEDPGVTPCFALGQETTRGIPWTCTADVPTTVAMLAVKALGHPTLYHELEVIDEVHGELVIANSGEHDLGWARPGRRPQLRRNGWFSTDRRCGSCAVFAGPPGPASLIAFTPHPAEPSGFRFVVAEGWLGDREFPRTGTANGAFRFAAEGSVVESFRRWCDAGPSHHSCCTTAHVGEKIAVVARFLGIGFTQIA